ncbi:MAG: hypothetical protein QXZ19_03300 [Thermoplasmata archaeon]
MAGLRRVFSAQEAPLGRIGLRADARSRRASLAVLAVVICVSASALSLGRPDGFGCAQPWPCERDGATSALPGFEWKPTSHLIVPRAAAAAVTLPSGDVMVIGGLTPDGPTATTEVFDSKLSVWRLGPQMSVKRVGHTATLLGDGRVLVTGGDTGSGTTGSAELIDPVKWSCVPAGSMSFARSGHAAALLSDGRVLVAGGTDWVTGVWSQAEVFDPSAGKWSPAGRMLSPRLFLSLLPLRDGDAIAIGGDIAGTSEVYDASTNAWSNRANLTSVRNGAAAAKVGNTILVAGGLVGGKPTNTSEIYDPARNAWSPAGEMSEPRARFTLSPMPGGRLLAAGSYADSVPKASCEVFDPVSRTWSQVPPMTVPRGEHAAAVLTTGAVLIIGGRSTTGITSSVEVFSEAPPVQPPCKCRPIDVVPLVEQATELPGNSRHGLIAKLLAAQAKYDSGELDVCANIMDAFYNQLRAFATNGHMTRDHATTIYDAYACVMECIGATPKPPLPEPSRGWAAMAVLASPSACALLAFFSVYPASDSGV